MKISFALIRITLFAFFVLNLSTRSAAQITALATGSSFGYTTTCVDFYDGTTGYVCGYNVGGACIRKTTNGGTVWSSVLFVTPLAADVEYNYVKSLRASTVILMGENTFFSDPAVFLSTNAGSTWTDVSPLTGSGLKDAYFLDSVSGYAVGNDGTVLKTSDGGQTWADRSVATSQDFTTTYFVDENQGFAASGNIVQRTTNGGLTWVADTITGLNVMDFVFFSPAAGYMLSGNGDIYQTLNGGNSWSLLTKSLYPQMYALEKSGNGIMLASATNNLCFDVPGTPYWQKYAGTAAFTAVSMCFINDSTAFAISGGGVLKKIVIRDPATYVPVVRFHPVNAVVCKDEPQQFLNDSKPGYTYRWYVNGIFQSSSYDFNYTFTSSGLYSVRLTAINPSNTTLRDSTTTTYTIPSVPVLNTYAVSASATTVCEGAVPYLHVSPSQSGAFYYITDSTGAPVTSSVNGTGGTLNFTLPNIYQTQTYTVVAKKVSTCDTAISTHTITINVVSLADVGTIITADRPYACFGESTFISVYNSEPGIMYRLKKNNVLTADSLAGNGGTLQLPTHPLYAQSFFTVVARNSMQCMRQFPNDTVRISQVHADYVPLNQNLFVGDTLLLDNALVAGDSLKWSFAPDASAYIDTSHNPIVSFSAAGIKSAQLIIKTQYGCTDSLQKNIYVYNVAPEGDAAFCLAKDIPYRSGMGPTKFSNVYDMNVDKNKNIYLSGYTATGYSYAFNFDPKAFILKCDSSMNVLWEKTIFNSTVTCKSVLASCITTDTSGNIFLGGKYFCDNLVIDTIALTSDKTKGEIFITKFDPNGVAKWIIRGRGTNPVAIGSGGPSSFTTDSEGYIYCSVNRYANNIIALTFPNGFVYTASAGQDEILVIKIDPATGNLVRVNSILANSGRIGGEYQISNSSWDSRFSFPLNPKLKFGPDGKLYLLGTAYTKVTAGSYVIDTLMSGPTNVTYFVAVADTALNWQNAFPLGAYTYGAHSWTGDEYKEDLSPAFDVDGAGNVYFSFRWYRLSTTADGIASARLNGMSFYTPGSVVAKYTNTGILAWANINENPLLSVKGMYHDSQNRLIMAGYFNNFYGYVSPSGLSLGQKAIGGRDIFMSALDPANGDILWARKYGSISGNETVNTLFKRTNSNDAFIAGTVAFGTDFPMDDNLIHNSMNNIILGKFNSDSVCSPNLVTGISWNKLPVAEQEMLQLQAMYLNDAIRIRITLKHSASLSLAIYDMLGNKITQLAANNRLSEGEYTWEYPGALSTGMYFVKVEEDNKRSFTQKVIVVN